MENIPSYPPNGDNQVDNLGTSFVRVPMPLVLTCLSELKVICSPLFLKRWVSDDAAGTASATSRFAGHSLTAYAASHVVAGGVVHGSDKGFAPFAPAVLFGNSLAGRGPQRRTVRTSQVKEHVKQ